ncbi:MAG: hypothetical protein GY844_09345 [Bradyrhizobium sp.]|nr:hypothetical protein [Bradyrhizobium sp.]
MRPHRYELLIALGLALIAAGTAGYDWRLALIAAGSELVVAVLAMAWLSRR